MRLPRMTTRRWMVAWALGSALTVLAWLAASYAAAHHLTRRQRPVAPEPVPAIAWAPLKSTRLRTRDGYDLGAWVAPGSEAAPAVVLLHGNGGGRGGCLDLAEILAAQGCGVLLVTMRAHGDSAGRTNDFGYSARLDVVAAVEYLERHQPGRPVLVAGRSLGSAAAVFAAGELGGRVRGYVLECPYRDLRTAVRNRTRAFLPWPLDRVTYAGLLVVSPLVVGDVDRIAPVEAVGAIPPDVPVLILAGGADDRAGPDEAGALHRRVNSHGRLIVFEGAGHLGLSRSDPARYKRAILDLVATAVPPTPSPRP